MYQFCDFKLYLVKWKKSWIFIIPMTLIFSFMFIISNLVKGSFTSTQSVMQDLHCKSHFKIRFLWKERAVYVMCLENKQTWMQIWFLKVKCSRLKLPKNTLICMWWVRNVRITCLWLAHYNPPTRMKTSGVVTVNYIKLLWLGVLLFLFTKFITKC